VLIGKDEVRGGKVVQKKEEAVRLSVYMARREVKMTLVWR